VKPNVSYGLVGSLFPFFTFVLISLDFGGIVGGRLVLDGGWCWFNDNFPLSLTEQKAHHGRGPLLVVGAGEDRDCREHGRHLDEMRSTNQGIVSICSQHMRETRSSQQRQRYVTSLSALVSTTEGSWNRGSSQGSIYDCLGFAVTWDVWKRTTDLPVRGVHWLDQWRDWALRTWTCSSTSLGGYPGRQGCSPLRIIMDSASSH